MLHNTKAIILRSVSYGETSLIVTAYTAAFGLQSYLVKGAKRAGKKGGGQAQYFQPGALLEMVVYYNELKNLQQIKEIKWEYIYQQVFSNVIYNAVLLFMLEMLLRSIRQAEQNAELFAFAENNFILLDKADAAVVANMPLYFMLHLAGFLGVKMENNFSETHFILDLQEGIFMAEKPNHQYFLEKEYAEYTFKLLQIQNPITLYRIKTNKIIRRQLLQAYEFFYQFHVAEFGKLKSIGILEDILG